MGIQGYRAWLEKNLGYKGLDLVRETPTGYFDHVMVDLNEILYSAARSSPDELKLFLKLYKILDNLFKLCMANKSIYIAFDGPASMAKLVTQRKRRLQKASKAKPNAKKSFDMLQICPGTEFMIRLKDAVSFYIHSRVNAYKFKNIEFIMSGPDVPGEGETKIIRRVNELKVRCPNDSIVIVGGDGDIIPMALMTHCRNISMLAYRNPTSTYIEIGEIEKIVEKQVVNDYRRTKNTVPLDTKTLCLDFACISLLQGNDYLPKFPGAVRLWRRYRAIKEMFPNESLINVNDNGTFSFNSQFLVSICDNKGPHRIPDLPIAKNFNSTKNSKKIFGENGEISNQSQKEEKEEEEEEDIEELDELEDNEEVEGESIVMDLKEENEGMEVERRGFVDLEDDDLMEVESDKGEEEEEEENEKEEEEEEVNEKDEEENEEEEDEEIEENSNQAFVVAEKYMKTLLWCLELQSTGSCPDYSWYYPFSKAPTPGAICGFLTNSADISKCQFFEYPVIDEPVSFPRNHQSLPPVPFKFALYLLPSAAQLHIPEPLRFLMEEDSLKSIYKEKNTMIDVSLIERAVARISAETLNAIHPSITRFGTEERYSSWNTHGSIKRFFEPPGFATNVRNPYMYVTLLEPLPPFLYKHPSRFNNESDALYGSPLYLALSNILQIPELASQLVPISELMPTNDSRQNPHPNDYIPRGQDNRRGHRGGHDNRGGHRGAPRGRGDNRNNSPVSRYEPSSHSHNSQNQHRHHNDHNEDRSGDSRNRSHHSPGGQHNRDRRSEHSERGAPVRGGHRPSQDHQSQAPQGHQPRGQVNDHRGSRGSRGNRGNYRGRGGNRGREEAPSLPNWMSM